VSPPPAEATASAGSPIIIAKKVEAETVAQMREMLDYLRERPGSAAIVLGSTINGRPSLVGAVTPDLVKRGLDAGKLVRQVAKVIGGGGGGSPTIAQAGGRDPDKLDEALELWAGLIDKTLSDTQPTSGQRAR